MIAVLEHELKSYFHTLTAYAFGVFLLCFIGIGAMIYNLQAAVSNFEFVLSFASLIFVVIVPILTMRVIAEERKQKTDQLLYSLPTSTTHVILGKYLALLVVYLVPLLIISLYPLVFSRYEEQPKTFTLSVGRNPEDVEAAQEDEEKLAALPAYVRVGDSAIVYEIAGGDYEQLMAVSYDDLRHKEVLWADFGSFTQMDVVLDGETYTLTTEGTGENAIWYYGETELDTADIQSAFSSLVADSFTEEQPTGQKEISLTVYLEQESNPTVQMEFYRYDGESCVAVVDGASVSLVPRSAVVDLMEAIRSVVL